MATRINNNQDKPIIPLRIGINTETVSVGNMGSNDHFDFTLLGHGVVLASRYETACEPFKVMVGESTYSAISEEHGSQCVKRLVPLKHASRLHIAYEYDPFDARPEYLASVYTKYLDFHKKSQKQPRFTTCEGLVAGSEYGTFNIVNYSLGGMCLEGNSYVGRNAVLYISLRGYPSSQDVLMPMAVEVRWGAKSSKNDGQFIHGVALIGANEKIKHEIFVLMGQMSGASQVS